MNFRLDAVPVTSNPVLFCVEAPKVAVKVTPCA